jgi:hypothetical protein
MLTKFIDIDINFSKRYEDEVFWSSTYYQSMTNKICRGCVNLIISGRNLPLLWTHLPKQTVSPFYRLHRSLQHSLQATTKRGSHSCNCILITTRSEPILFLILQVSLFANKISQIKEDAKIEKKISHFCPLSYTSFKERKGRDSVIWSEPKIKLLSTN